MKIFVSHAIKDKDLISKVKLTLEPHGLKLLIAEHQLNFETTATPKIESMIKSCDVAIILLTKNGFNSKFVNQEIGYIQSLRKPYIQIVQIGLEKKIAGFNFGRDYISFDPLDPDISLKKMSTSLLGYWKKIAGNSKASYEQTN